MRINKYVLVLVTTVLFVSVVLSACGSKPLPATTQTQSAGVPQSPILNGETLMNDRCTVCHTTDRIKQAQKTKDEWQQTVTRMVGKGAKLSAEEQTILVEYLVKTYAP